MNEYLLEFAGRQADAGATSLPETFKQMAVNAQFFLKNRMAGCSVGKRIDAVTDFDLNLKKGSITFHFEGGESVKASIQIAGTLANDGSYMWAWGHPDVPEMLQQAAWAVQQFGDRQQVEELLTRGGDMPRDTVDDFLAIAAYIADASGVFLGDHGGGGKVCVLYFLKKDQ